MQPIALNKKITSQPSDNGCEVLITTNLNILNQLEIGLIPLTHAQYTDSVDQKTSSIGKHMRHIIEFYQALFSVLQNPHNTGLCYDERQRDMRLEVSKEAALEELNTIREFILTLPMDDINIQLSSIIDTDKPMFTMNTTFQRELFYLLDHTIHHMALIKMLAEKLGVTLNQGFGLAQSTKAHESSGN